MWISIRLKIQIVPLNYQMPLSILYELSTFIRFYFNRIVFTNSNAFLEIESYKNFPSITFWMICRYYVYCLAWSSFWSSWKFWSYCDTAVYSPGSCASTDALDEKSPSFWWVDGLWDTVQHTSDSSVEHFGFQCTTHRIPVWYTLDSNVVHFRFQCSSLWIPM